MLTKKYSIVADQAMPAVEKLFAEFADVKLIDGRKITRNHLMQADVLLCRSVTQVDQSLLQNTPVSFVGSATIGTDHLDTQWLGNNQVSWCHAAGCNSAAVAQYVMSAISYWLLSKKANAQSMQQLKVGILGAGRIGSLLADYLQQLSVKSYLCDPPLQRTGDKRDFVTPDELLQCDVISLHVPLSLQGEDKTFHWLDRQRLCRLTEKQLLINASRGAVIDNSALLNYLQLGNSPQVVLDVFENEPDICKQLVDLCLLATPHIAGHTLEGKLRGSYLVYQAFCEHFSLPKKISQASLYPQKKLINGNFNSPLQLLLEIYNIQADSEQLSGADEKTIVLMFDHLRKNYFQVNNTNTRRDYAFCCLSEETANRFPEIKTIIDH